MRILRQIEELNEPCAGGVGMTIGVFDAIHVGHQALIRRAIEAARGRGLPSLAFTFERHPLATLAPAYCPPTILQPERKAELLGELGVDLCLLLPFTPEFAAIGAERFVEEVLAGRCRARHIVCGANFTFGAGGKGGPRLLAGLAPRLGFEVEVFDLEGRGHSAISSSRIRGALLEGDVAEAERMLTRRYGFEARVVTGDARGRTIGFPTANLEPRAGQLVPADGVYAVTARVAGEGPIRGAMLNIGRRPTFAGATRSIEAHLFDFSGDLVGKTLEIAFAARIRDERKFSGVAELVEQLKKDESACRQILAGAS